MANSRRYLTAVSSIRLASTAEAVTGAKSLNRAQAEALRIFRTAFLCLIHAASCRFRYSLWTSSGGLVVET